MIPRGPSKTAVMTAVARGLHREEPPPWVLDDHLALGLAGDEGVPLTQKLRDELVRLQDVLALLVELQPISYTELVANSRSSSEDHPSGSA